MACSDDAGRRLFEVINNMTELTTELSVQCHTHTPLPHVSASRMMSNYQSTTVTRRLRSIDTSVYDWTSRLLNSTTASPPPPHHNRFTALFPGQPGEPVPEENFWTLWSKGRLTEADTPTIRLGATPSGLTSAHLHHPPHIFYRPDALPAAQPTASKH